MFNTNYYGPNRKKKNQDKYKDDDEGGEFQDDANKPMKGDDNQKEIDLNQKKDDKKP